MGNQLVLRAPVSGPLLPIESVPDPVFAQKTVGPGVAIDPVSNILVAPCDGTVSMIHRAHHAITVQADGAQVLIHIGLDTVNLKGVGFAPRVKVGDRVRVGQPLIEFDADTIAQNAKSLITIMVVTDATEDTLGVSKPGFVRAGVDEVAAVAKKAAMGTGTAPITANRNRAESAEIVVDLPTGLHARPAALLVGMAKSYRSEIQIQKDRQSANAKSVVGIMGLEIGLGHRVRFVATGPDAEQAVRELEEFLRDLEEAPEPVSKPVPAKPIASSDKNTIVGVGVSSGVAIGRVHQVRADRFNIIERATGSPDEEKHSLDEAVHTADTQLRELISQVKSKTDNARAAIFAAHLELLHDPDILFDVAKLIAKSKSAAFAWNQTVNTNAERLAKLNNELLANRANDLRDVGRRVLRILVGERAATSTEIPLNSVLIAENLTPSETAQLDRDRVLAFCTTTGGATSHVAILARSLGLPAVAGIDARALTIASGTEVILDGDRGEMRLNPSEEDKNRARKVQTDQEERRKAAQSLAHQPASTRDGQKVEIAANIGSAADARQAVAAGADGVGLLRSEFLFLERETAPTEEEQYRVYQEIADILGERPLVIRTLDVGGDKPLKYLPIETEENPFLGVRGIRVGFLHPEILRQQLRAILRVKTKGKLCVMFPMIASIEEFRAAKAMLEDERAKLGATGVQVGIMVEVPSVALTADVFAREVDFFSVGTNDLTQYALAMDRGHKGLARQVDALHPSVLKMIQLAVQAAHAHGKWVGVCGGLASDVNAVAILLGLGVDELSVSIPTVPLIKSAVRETDSRAAAALAKRAVTAENSAAVRELKIESEPGGNPP